MEKPITMKIAEFDEALVDMVNNCGLPKWKVLDELQKFIPQVAQVAQKEAELERTQWEKENDNEEK